jgi:hypothetical protein
LPDILGDDSGTEESVDGGTVPGITAWSIQAQMIKNLQRLVKALIGGYAINTDYGRIASGLSMIGAYLQLQIRPGYGFTNMGNIVVVEREITYTNLLEGANHLTLLHKSSNRDPNSNPIPPSNGGLTTNIIGESGSSDVVYDDFAALCGTNISNQTWSDKIIVRDNSKTKHDDGLYLGNVNVSGGEIADPLIENRPFNGTFKDQDGNTLTVSDGIIISFTPHT